MKKMYLFVFSLACLTTSLLVTAQTYLHNIAMGSESRAEFVQFVDVVLRQVPSPDLLKAIDNISSQNPLQSEEQFYTSLLKKSDDLRPPFFLLTQMNALSHQKKILTGQAQQLMSGRKKIDGYLEIGTPGTYIEGIKSFAEVSGIIFVLNEKQAFADRFQACSFNPFKKFLPYDAFVSLNNYEKISEESIASASVDLVTCFIGLHHIPLEKIDNFVASIARVLRPGGSFLLRDHDTQNSEHEHLISSAHSIYNIIATSTSWEQEKDEFRNFQPLEYWISLLEMHGFEISSERMLQEGDPTLNTMIRCVKKASNVHEKLDIHSRELQDTDTLYKRDFMQGTLSASEWVNVDVSQEYGKFINHTPFYEFPYMKSVGSFWNVFSQSWKLARKNNGFFKTATSPYILMGLFMGVSMTVEYTAKSVIAFPLRLMYAGEEALRIKMIVCDPHNELANINGHQEPAPLTVLQQYPDIQAHLIEAPRYKEFLKIILSMAQTGITIKEIAGQKEIHFKVSYSDNVIISDVLQGIARSQVNYTWTLPTQVKTTYATLTVPVEQLLYAIRVLQAQDIEVLYIYDF